MLRPTLALTTAVAVTGFSIYFVHHTQQTDKARMRRQVNRDILAEATDAKQRCADAGGPCVATPRASA